jgi:Protein of unknown function (DUF3667)
MTCLNCGAGLRGAFCAACGQRSVPANPTVSELAGDAWQELSGYDGRIALTFRGLLRPGHLTAEYLQGRRARYLPPIRLYLIVSVAYFLVSASTPLSTDRSADITGPAGMKIQVTDRSGGSGPLLTPEDRAEILKNVDQEVWFIRPMLRAFAEDPEAFRARIFTIMPRVFFGLLPVFAAIVAMFYRGRTFPTALVFATHVHAFAFLIFAVSELAKLTQQAVVMGIVGVGALLVFVVYAVRAFRAVFGGTWFMTTAKALGVGIVYLFASIPAFIIILAWASLT